MNDNNYYTAVIILNYNNFEDTINCIESVEKYNTGRIKLIIVDNASKRKGAVESLEHYLTDRYDNRLSIYTEPMTDFSQESSLTYCSYIKSKNNDGYACGNNKALKLAEQDSEIKYIIIVNNDVLFVENIIPKLQKEYEANDKTGILSPLLYKKGFSDIDYNCARKSESAAVTIGRFIFYYINFWGIKNRWDKRQQYLRKCPELKSTYKFEIELPSGSCLFINKELFRSIGYFDSNTFLYYEENILYQKLKRLGKINYILTGLKCIHLGASSTKKEKGYFMIKASADSACYYISNYTQVPDVVKFLFKLYIYNVFLPLARLQKKIRKYKLS